MVAVDTNAERYALNRDNAVILPKWTGDPQDKGLVGIIPFLECMCTMVVGGEEGVVMKS